MTVWSRQLKRQLSNPALLALMLLLPLASVAIAACSELYEPDSRVWFGRFVEANPRFTPQWSPDGAHVVFTLNWPRNGNSNNGSTYVARSDGSGVRRVSEGTGEYNVDYSPDVSQDGSRIVYTTAKHLTKGDYDPWGATRNFEIEVSALDGSDRRRLTENGDLDISPLWSPDGRRIAFARIDDPDDRGRDGGIYVMGSAGSDVRRIVVFRRGDWQKGEDVTERFDSDSLTWSPDGESLAFVLDELEWLRDENREHLGSVDRNVLYTIAADGSRPSQLIVASDSSEDAIVGTPAWSPNGQSLAFLHVERGRLKLSATGADGSGLRELADTGLVRQSWKQIAFSLSWSPDGTKILFALGEAYRPTNGTIYVVNADGSDLSKVGQGTYVSWSPDGSTIAISNLYNEESGIVLSTIAPDGSALRVLVWRDTANGLVTANAAIQDTTVDLKPCSSKSVVPEPEANPGLVRDCWALLGLRDALAGRAELNWNNHVSIVEWEGIAVGGSPLRVHQVVLRDRSLTGTLPPELGRLTELRKLDVASWADNSVPNVLTGAIPLELSSLTKLITLDLSGNSLSGGIPAELGSLAELELLFLGGNFLTGPIPPELGRLTKFRVLSLEGNFLSGNIPPELGGLSQLRGLELDSNQLSGSIPPELGKLTSLDGLDLSNNWLSGSIPPELGNLTNLDELNLSNNRLSGSIPPELGRLSNLRRLYMGNNELAGNIPPELGGLTKLLSLTLGGNELTGCIPSGLRGVAETNDLNLLGLDYCSSPES